jgi:chromosome segregation ATPase
MVEIMQISDSEKLGNVEVIYNSLHSWQEHTIEAQPKLSYLIPPISSTTNTSVTDVETPLSATNENTQFQEYAHSVLEQQRDDFKDLLADALTKNSELLAMIDELVRQKEELEDDVVCIDESFQDEANKNEELLARIAELEQQRGESSENKSKMSTATSDYEVDLFESFAELHREQENNAVLLASIADSGQNVDKEMDFLNIILQLQNDKADVVASMDQLRKDKGQLERELEEALRKWGISAKFAADAVVKNAVLLGEIEQLYEEKEDLENEIKSMDELFLAEAKAAEDAATKNEALLTTIDQMQKVKEDLMMDLEALEADLESLLL